MMRASGFMASRFRIVSLKLSPFAALLVFMLKLIISALNLFAASSKELRVRVLGSKNRLMMVFPLRVGTFLTSRVDTSKKDSAVLRTVVISEEVRFCIPRRCLCVKDKLSLLFDSRRFDDKDFIAVIDFFQANLYALSF